MRLSLMVTFVFCFLSSYCQSLEKTERGYLLDNIEYKAKADILQLLSESKEATKAYTESCKYRNRANFSGTLSIIGFLSVPIIYKELENFDGDSPHYGLLLAGYSAAAVGIISGLVWSYNFDKAKEKRNAVVDLYSDSLVDYQQRSPNPRITVAGSGSKIGLFYTF